jgi:hypothetical protein
VKLPGRDRASTRWRLASPSAMSSEEKVEMNPTDVPRATQIALSEGDCEELLVTLVGPNLYRLEESSLLGEVMYHDVIEAEARTDGSLRLLRVVKPSGLKTASWILIESLFEASALTALLDKVVALGGNWEKTFGGMLTVHIPSAQESSIMGEFNAFFGSLPHGASQR